MSTSARAQRYLLLAFVGSLALSAAVGITVITSGTRSSIASAILGSTVLLAAASILGMAAAVVARRKSWHPIGPLGLIAALIALLLSWPWIWIECLDPWRVFGGALPAWYAELWRVVGIAWVVAVAVTHVGLFSLARLHPTYLWLRRWTVIAILLLAVIIVLGIISEFSLLGEHLAFRAIAVLAIVDVCGSLAVPVLHRLTTIRAREAVRTIDLHLSLTCPRCAHTQTVAVGRSRCVQCKLGFLLEIEEDLCPGCGYPLYRLSSGACPECGRRVTTSANIAPPGRDPSSAPS